MLAKIVLILIALLIVFLVVIPLVLNMFGVPIFQFESAGGGGTNSVTGILITSTDGGRTWVDAGLSEDTDARFPSKIFDIAFHPTNPDTLFLGGLSSGLWRSETRGVSWTRVSDRGGVLSPQSDVYAVVVSPQNPDIIYTAVFQNNRGRILKSEDGSGSFEEIYSTTADRFGVFDLFLNPRDSDHVRIVTGQGGLLETRDGGETWRVIRWFGRPLTHLFVNPAFPDEMYVLDSGGTLFKTFNRGFDWTEVTIDADVLQRQFQPQPIFFNPFTSARRSLETFAVDPRNFATLYAGSQKGLFRSLDGGISWKRVELLIPPNALPVRAVAVHPGTSRTFFVGAGTELSRTDNNGTDWIVHTFKSRLPIDRIFIHPSRPDVMFITFGR